MYTCWKQPSGEPPANERVSPTRLVSVLRQPTTKDPPSSRYGGVTCAACGGAHAMMLLVLPCWQGRGCERAALSIRKNKPPNPSGTQGREQEPTPARLRRRPPRTLVASTPNRRRISPRPQPLAAAAFQTRSPAAPELGPSTPSNPTTPPRAWPPRNPRMAKDEPSNKLRRRALLSTSPVPLSLDELGARFTDGLVEEALPRCWRCWSRLGRGGAGVGLFGWGFMRQLATSLINFRVSHDTNALNSVWRFSGFAVT